ncbi:hypothetical protein WMY93_032521 [Mugilogobius chulae]|uniref:THAP-type domain-containing protein n=1 Tax=Mugilogobius chulae TaxID=88201 RepID=A0AAW0MRM0_9GOBI
MLASLTPSSRLRIVSDFQSSPHSRAESHRRLWKWLLHKRVLRFVSELQTSGQNTAAVKALELFKNNARLCDLHFSKKDLSGVSGLERQVSCDERKGDFNDVHFLTENNVCMMLSYCEEAKDFSAAAQAIGRIFSNSDSLMKSFRRDDDKKPQKQKDEPETGAAAAVSNQETSEISDLNIDIDAVRRVYERILSIDEIQSALVDALVFLTPNLELDLEYLDVYETTRTTLTSS